MVGNAKRWREGILNSTIEQDGKSFQLKARKVKKLADAYLIEFSWEPESIHFSEIIEMNGLVPLPPYLNREAVESDKSRYQTVYARYDGSVAAPTAGLHFTDSLLKEIKNKGIESDKVTLHVGAGTFKPVISNTIAEHDMHAEKLVVSRSVLLHLYKKMESPIIPVGTTSMRTLESLFWLALKIYFGDESMYVDQWDPYRYKIPDEFDGKQAIRVLLNYLEKYQKDSMHAETRLMIAPGYQFRFASGLISNFHQPKSTLLLLVAALIGDQWNDAYKFAMSHGFRFLSYGDSCLFLP
jgi:S-adenosylmethionine:tRNA ribosyltransferase-isomerase